MGYAFHGVLLIGPQEDAPIAALTDRFGGAAARFDTPVAGTAVAFAADHDLSKGVIEREALPTVEALRAWSADFPDLDLIALTVECFGGVCDQGGAAIRGGRILAAVDPPEIDHPRPSPLSRLFAALGVANAKTRFAPLERGYFPTRTG